MKFSVLAVAACLGGSSFAMPSNATAMKESMRLEELEKREAQTLGPIFDSFKSFFGGDSGPECGCSTKRSILEQRSPQSGGPDDIFKNFLKTFGVNVDGAGSGGCDCGGSTSSNNSSSSSTGGSTDGSSSSSSSSNGSNGSSSNGSNGSSSSSNGSNGSSSNGSNGSSMESSSNSNGSNGSNGSSMESSSSSNGNSNSNSDSTYYIYTYDTDSQGVRHYEISVDGNKSCKHDSKEPLDKPTLQKYANECAAGK